MAGVKEREARKSVRLSVRFKDGTGWSDASVLNLSSRGLMAVCFTPPAKGSYLEVRRGNTVAIGRVVWSGGDRFGLMTQDPIDLASFTDPGASPARGKGERRTIERNTAKAPPRPADLAAKAARNEQLSHGMQFVAIALGVAVAAMLIGDIVLDVLASPLQQIDQVVGRTPQSG